MTQEVKPAAEPVVLDAECHVLHDPKSASGEKHHSFNGSKIFVVKPKGIIPKLLVGGVFAGLLLLGLTIAGVVLGVLFVTFLARTLFKPKFK